MWFKLIFAFSSFYFTTNNTEITAIKCPEVTLRANVLIYIAYVGALAPLRSGMYGGQRKIPNSLGITCKFIWVPEADFNPSAA